MNVITMSVFDYVTSMISFDYTHDTTRTRLSAKGRAGSSSSLPLGAGDGDGEEVEGGAEGIDESLCLDGETSREEKNSTCRKLRSYYIVLLPTARRRWHQLVLLNILASTTVPTVSHLIRAVLRL